MSKKDREPNQNLSKLVSKVKVLSKTVDELEKEVEALKSKICRNQDKKPSAISSESKKVVNPTPKSSRFRLKFFRKSDKTKENGTPNDSSKITETKKKDDSTRDVISSNNPPSDRQPSSGKNYADDSNEVEVKPKKKSDFTKTSNHSTQISRQRSQTQVQENHSKSDSCCCRSSGNKSTKNIKNSKYDKDKIVQSSQRKMCSDDCPYLSGQSYCSDNVEKVSSKPFKNKKLMVNLIGSNRDFKDKMQRNRNFVLDCKFLQNADFRKLMDTKDEKRERKIKLFSMDNDESSRCSKKDCKNSSKNCKTKNVLNIKKAILTQEPPMIFISPELEKCKIRCEKKKQKSRYKKFFEDTEVCCDDCCPSTAEGGKSENFNSFECPCSSFAASRYSMNTKYRKLCQM